MYVKSCKIEAAFPNSHAALVDYLAKRWQMEKWECCRDVYQELIPEDKAVVICHTCASILEESSKSRTIEYAWQYINQDDTFVFPDYQGEKITLQDCYMAKERLEVQAAVRELLQKMNFTIVEMEANRAEADFCGLLTTPILAANAKLAPKHFCQNENFTQPSAEERAIILKEQVKKITTKRVVCYCGACRAALKAGGAEVVHLLELLFP